MATAVSCAAAAAASIRQATKRLGRLIMAMPFEYLMPIGCAPGDAWIQVNAGKPRAHPKARLIICWEDPSSLSQVGLHGPLRRWFRRPRSQEKAASLRS